MYILTHLPPPLVSFPDYHSPIHGSSDRHVCLLSDPWYGGGFQHMMVMLLITVVQYYCNLIWSHVIWVVPLVGVA